jgi:cell division protein FtsN
MARKKARSKGGVGGTVLGLLALGVCSSVFGAMVLGPGISKFTGKDPDLPEVSKTEQRAARRPIFEPDTDRDPRPERQDPDPGTRDESKSGDPESDGPSTRPMPEPEAIPVPPVEVSAPDKPARETSSKAEPAARIEERRAPRSEKADTERRRETPRKPRTNLKPEPAASVPVEHPESAPAAPDAEGAAQRVYRIRVGRFSSREEAEKVRAEVDRASGGGASVYKIGETYRVQVGAYRRKENADRVSAALRSRSLQPEVDQTKATPRPE